MSLLANLLGRLQTKPRKEQSVAVDCPHTVLAPKWDSAQDIGIEDRAVRFECDVCHKLFTPDEARAVRESLGQLFRPPENEQWENPR